MMMNLLNKNKLQIKYYLNLYSSFKDYPTKEDLLYELVKNSENLSEGLFDYKIMKYSVSSKLSKESFEDFILYAKKNKFIESCELKDTYKLVKHLWE